MLSHIESLQLHATTHRLRDRATANCWKWIGEAIADGDLQSLSTDDIELRFERCALVFSSGQVSYPFIETRIGIFARSRPNPVLWKGLEQLGHYRLITDLDGQNLDDYCVLNDSVGDTATG